MKSCASSVTSSARRQPSWPAVQTRVSRVISPSAAIRPSRAFENGPRVSPPSAMCQTCSTGGGGGGAACAAVGRGPQGPCAIWLAIAMPMPMPSPAPIPPPPFGFAAAAVIASAAEYWVNLPRSPAIPMEVRLSSAASTAGGRDTFSM